MKNFINRSIFYLVIVFIVASALLFFLMGITYKHLQKQTEDQIKVYQSFDTSMELEKLYSDLKNIETERRNFIVTQNPIYLEKIPQISRSIRQRIKNLKADLEVSPEQIQKVSYLYQLVDRKLQIVNTTLKNHIPRDVEEELLVSLTEGNKLMKDITLQIEDLLDTEQSVLQERKDGQQFSQKNTPIYLYIISLFSFGLLGFSFYRIMTGFRKLQEATQDLKLSLETSDMAQEVGSFGIWFLDLETSEYHFSFNAYQVLGYTANEFEPSAYNILKLVHPEDLENVKAEVDKILRHDYIKSFKCRLQCKSGTYQYFQIAGKIVEIQNQKPVVLGIITDISDEIEHQLKQEENNKMLQEQNKQLEANNQELQAFNYAASHDLQEPLRKIETFISRLKDKDYDKLSKSGKLYVDRSTLAAGRMRKLIDDLLQFSRSTRKDETFEICDMSKIMDTALDSLATLIEEKKGQVTVENLPTLRGVPFQIQQMFMNIIGNSLKYSKESVPPKIHISVCKTQAPNDPMLPKKALGSFYKITFSDNGIGFEQQYAERIFMLFSRLHSRNEYEGTGIGLAICKKIVDNHNGYIFAHSQPGEGTQITVFLPEFVEEELVLT